MSIFDVITSVVSSIISSISQSNSTSSTPTNTNNPTPAPTPAPTPTPSPGNSGGGNSGGGTPINTDKTRKPSTPAPAAPIKSDSFIQTLENAAQNPDSGAVQVITNPDGTKTEILQNKVYETVGDYKFVNSQESWTSGLNYIATSRILTPEELAVTAYRYEHWNDTLSGGGSGLSYSQALDAVKAEAEKQTHTSAKGTTNPADMVVSSSLKEAVAAAETDEEKMGLAIGLGLRTGISAGTTINTVGNNNDNHPLGEYILDKTVSPVITDVIKWRDGIYENAAEKGTGFLDTMMMSAPALIADFLPLDLIHVCTKAYTYDTGELTNDDYTYALIDAASLVATAATLGVGAVPARLISTGAKTALKAGLTISSLGISQIPAIGDILSAITGSDEEDTPIIEQEEPQDEEQPKEQIQLLKQTVWYDEEPELQDWTQTPTPTENPTESTGGGGWDSGTIGYNIISGGAGISPDIDKNIKSYLIPAIIAAVAVIALIIAVTKAPSIKAIGAR